MSFKAWTVEEYWDADRNWPPLRSGVGQNGRGYIVSVPGATLLDGNNDWRVNDVIMFVLDQWVKISKGVVTPPVGGGGGSLTYETYADFAGAGSWDGGVKRFRTNGRYTPGDFGGGTYIDIGATDPGLPLGNVVIHDTANGRYLMLAPGDDGDIWVGACGARAMWGANHANGEKEYYTDATTYDISDGWEAAVDYVSFNPLGYCGIKFGPGTHYHTRELRIKGFSTRITGFGGGFSGGGPTFMRPASNVSGFIIEHQSWSLGSNGGIYGNNVFYTVGWHLFCNGNVYVVTVAGTSSAVGSGPSGTGAGIVNGTMTVDYVRPRSRVEKSSQSFNGIIDQFQFFSHWDRSHDPYRQSFGILGRQRATVRSCNCSNFSAYGIAFIANGNEDFPLLAGNVNGFQVYNCTAYYNGLDAVHFDYADGNAGFIYGIDTRDNGRWAFNARDFLGNTYVGIETAYDGLFSEGVTQYHNAVTHNGYRWKARMQRSGVEGTLDYTLEPGLNEGLSASPWICIGGDGTATATGTFPDWVSGTTYEPGGSINNDNANSATVFIGTYVEGSDSTAQLGNRSSVFGGPMSNIIVPTQGTVNYLGSWLGSLHTVRTEARTTGPSKIYEFSATLGPANGNVNNALNRNILSWSDYTHAGEFVPRNVFGFSGETANADNASQLDFELWWTSPAVAVVYRITGRDTAKTFGTGASVGAGYFQVPRLIVGGRMGRGGGRLDFNSAPPLSGDGPFAQGDRVYNENAAVGQPQGWVCTVAGTPGTWVAMPNL